MEEEHSPVLDIVGDEPKASLLEASVRGSSSGDTSSGESKNGANVEGKESRVVDPRESAWSYDFGASTVTVGRIQQLEALGYFAEGSAREWGEEVVPDLADNEAIILEEFFTTGLWMPSQLALTDILVKF
jgi:hypothetical protein